MARSTRWVTSTRSITNGVFSSWKSMENWFMHHGWIDRWIGDGWMDVWMNGWIGYLYSQIYYIFIYPFIQYTHTYIYIFMYVCMFICTLHYIYIYIYICVCVRKWFLDKFARFRREMVWIHTQLGTDTAEICCNSDIIYIYI